jgi:hypothetical protein
MDDHLKVDDGIKEAFLRLSENEKLCRFFAMSKKIASLKLKVNNLVRTM